MHRVVAVTTDEKKYLQDIAIGHHRLQADEPVSIGGGDAAPDPYELLLGALGACTAITVQMFADRRRWPLEKVYVRLSHAKSHAQDCAQCDSPGAKLDRVELAIELQGNLTEEQRRKLMDVADHCPLHRTLVAGIDIERTESASG
jgi:putative redox protein